MQFWLEEMGFEVQLSEHTDFERRPEAGTFEACFESIRNADFYVLLIGKRRGSWYDEPARVTVTRQEYRCALESFSACDKPRIIAAIRADVLTALRERRALGSPGGPSTLEDPALTAEFVGEVRREDQVRTSVRESGDGPAANWLAPFRDFRELVSILRATLRVQGPLPRAALLEGLRDECESNLRVLLMKHGGQPFYYGSWLHQIRPELVLTADLMRDVRRPANVTYDQMKSLVWFLVTGIPSPDRFTRVALNEAIASGALLDYDRIQNRFVPSPLLEAVYRLREELDVYAGRIVFLKEHQDVISSAWGQVRQSRASARVPVLSIFALYAIHDNVQNLVSLLLGILRYLYGHTRELAVGLRPVTPVAEFAEAIRRQRVSREDLQDWLREDNFLLRLGLLPTEEQLNQQQETEQKIREIIGEEEYQRWKTDLMDALQESIQDMEERETGN